MKAPDVEVTGSVARFASRAREIVSLVACAAAASRSTLPVSTDWLVTRNVSALATLCCAETCQAHAQNTTAMANVLDRLLVILCDLNVCRQDRAVGLRCSGHLDGVAVRNVLAASVAVIRVPVSHDEAAARGKPDRRTRSAQRRQQARQRNGNW